MKKITGIVLALALLSFSASEPKVYVCDSEKSVAFHQYKDCRGLQKCTHNIIYVTEKEAKNKYFKRACKICY